ncbi:MAG: SDR family NAD(P)-dependent oxidoreductase [Gemmobacter sp.]|uniref:SDR family NAD(P)-dependent oxidoreductase n=1 Tax=Gemmobacter sp. TaxID=1898957 RepID=UPI00391BB564
MRARKNPLHRTRRPALPPGARSRAAHLLTAAAAEGHFALPCCTACGRFAWPMPELCPACLGDIALVPAPQGARLLSATTAEVPADSYFRERAPWRVGLVQMDCGPQALVHLSPGASMGDTLRLSLLLDRAGNAVLHAAREGEDMASDPQWQEMVADPRDRRVLITDARHIAALPLAQALLSAGAAGVYMGVPDPWKPLTVRAAPEAMPGVQMVALDVTSDRSVHDLAAQIGGKVEILINTADLPRPGGLMAPAATAEAKAAMETVAFGLMRLARAFGPALAARGADGDRGAVAWVNLLSVFAHAHPPGLAGYAAAHAAALAFSRALRADLAQGGVRLLTAFAGPTDDAWFQGFAQPKVTGKALADGIVAALLRGQEEAVIGDLARDLMDRLRENPKGVERELAQGRL